MTTNKDKNLEIKYLIKRVVRCENPQMRTIGPRSHGSAGAATCTQLP